MFTNTQHRSLSCTVEGDFESTLGLLRSALQREGLQIICEIPFHHEFKKSIGVDCRKYSVLVVWSPFEAYRAVLTEDNTGLLTPFNVVVTEEGRSTVVVVHQRLGAEWKEPISLALLAKDLESKIRRVFAVLEAKSHSAEVMR